MDFDIITLHRIDNNFNLYVKLKAHQGYHKSYSDYFMQKIDPHRIVSNKCENCILKSYISTFSMILLLLLKLKMFQKVLHDQNRTEIQSI